MATDMKEIIQIICFMDKGAILWVIDAIIKANTTRAKSMEVG